MIGGKVLDPSSLAAYVRGSLVMAGWANVAHVLHLSRTRDWPVLSADPGRLRRLDPDVEIDDV